MAQVSGHTPDHQIGLYLNLVAEARKQAQSPYSRLFVPGRPDPRAIMLKQLAKLYALIGVALLLAALASGAQALLGSWNGSLVRTA